LFSDLLITSDFETLTADSSKEALTSLMGRYSLENAIDIIERSPTIPDGLQWIVDKITGGRRIATPVQPLTANFNH